MSSSLGGLRVSDLYDADAPSQPPRAAVSSARQCELCGFKYRVAVDVDDKAHAVSVCAQASPDACSAAIAAAASTSSSDAIAPSVPLLSSALPACLTTPPHSTVDEKVVLRCTRCGLITTFGITNSRSTLDCEGQGEPSAEMLAQPLQQSCIMEAARAYKFILLTETTPLLKDLAQIVVDFLLWYRGPDDFTVGDLVDAKDLRGNWHLARIDAIENEKLLIHFLGFASKWDQWISSQSNSLAPCHTKTAQNKDPYSVRLRSAMSWTGKQQGAHSALQFGQPATQLPSAQQRPAAARASGLGHSHDISSSADGSVATPLGSSTSSPPLASSIIGPPISIRPSAGAVGSAPARATTLDYSRLQRPAPSLLTPPDSLVAVTPDEPDPPGDNTSSLP